MAGPITNFVTRLLIWNEETITKPLLKGQGCPWRGTLPAAAQIVTSTITAVVAGVFAALAGIAGVVCKLVGAQKIGDDLLRSADIAFRGPKANVAGALIHLIIAGGSLVNAVSITGLAQCLAPPESSEPSATL